MNGSNIDVLIYVNNLITELRNGGIFDDPKHIMLDSTKLEEKLIKISTDNLEKDDELEITEEQLFEAMNDTIKTVINETINSLYDKGLFEINGIDSNGNCTYIATPLGIEINDEIKKKNI